MTRAAARARPYYTLASVLAGSFVYSRGVPWGGAHQPLYFFKHLFVFFHCRYLKFTGFEGGNIATDLIFKCSGNITILAQEVFGVFATLAKADIANVEPGAALLNETHL